MKTDNPMTREEIADTLTGRARTDARHALSVLSEAAGSPAGEEEAPPLPADLRDQWQETYGGAAPAPAPAGDRDNWITRLAGIFTRPRIAWAGGLAAWRLEPYGWLLGHILAIFGILEAIFTLLETGNLSYALATTAFPFILLWYLNRESVKNAFGITEA